MPIGQAGVRHIVALRGDSPVGGPRAMQPPTNGYENGAERWWRDCGKLHPFEISVAAYPECHPDSDARSMPTWTI